MKGEQKYKEAVERLTLVGEEIKTRPFKGGLDAQKLSLNVTGRALEMIIKDVRTTLEVGTRAIKKVNTLQKARK